MCNINWFSFQSLTASHDVEINTHEKVSFHKVFPLVDVVCKSTSIMIHHFIRDFTKKMISKKSDLKMPTFNLDEFSCRTFVPRQSSKRRSWKMTFWKTFLQARWLRLILNPFEVTSILPEFRFKSWWRRCMRRGFLRAAMWSEKVKSRYLW